MHADRENRFFRAWAELVLKLRYLVVPLLAALAVLSLLEVRANLEVETSPEYFAQGSSDASETLDAFREDFGRDDQYLVLVHGDVFTADFLERLQALHRGLETIPIELEQRKGRRAGQTPAPALAAPAQEQGEEGWAEDDAAGFGAAPAPAPAAAPAAGGDGWGEDDAVGFGTAPAPAPAAAPTPAPAATGDDWGEDDAVGFGTAPAAAPAAQASGDDWGADDAAGFGAPPSQASPSTDDWGAGGGSIIEDVTSLVNYRQTVFEGGSLRVRGLMDTPPVDLAAFKQQVLADPTIVGTVVGADGDYAVLAVRTQVVDNDASRQIQVALDTFVQQFQAPGFEVEVTGMPALEHAVSSSLMRDLRVLVGVAFALMAGVLFVLFRTLVGVLAPLLVMGLSIVFTLAVMALTGTPVTLLTNIVPAFLICVGLGDSVHVQSVYRDLRRQGVPNRDAVISAVGSTGMPVLFTTLTTMVGLLSFRSASTLGIQELGLVAAFGVGIALLMSVTVIPLTSTLMGPPKVREEKPGKLRNDPVDRLLRACTGLSDSPRKRWQVLAGTVAITALAAWGISRVQVFHDPLTWLPQGHPVQTSIRTLDQHVGGTSNVVLVVEADGELGVKDQRLLARMDELDAWVRGFTHPRTGEHIVGNSLALTNIVKETNRALHEGDPAFYAIPADQRGVSDNLLLFESAGPRDLRRVATADLRKTHITWRLDWMDAGSLLPLRDHLLDGIQRTLGDLPVRATVTGTAYSLVSTVGALIGDMIRSFGLAVAVIAMMMALLLRDVKLAVVAMVPNVLPVAYILGFMGFVGIPIDMATLLIASIVIGIAVDTTIHYLHQYRVVWLAEHDVEAGIRYALSHAGRALVGTSIILAIGFGAYMASSMVNVQRFGVLVAVACGCALLTNLILVPAMLRTIHGGPRATR